MVATPPFSPQGMRVGLLKELAEALDGLGPVIDTALDVLTVAETELALNSLGSKDRQAIMRGLGFRKVEPRRFGRVLSEQVLKRVRRGDDTHRLCAVSHLTARIMDDIDRLVGQPGPDRTGDGLVDRWGTRLLQLAIFSHLRSSVFDAHLLVWVVEHDWFGAEVDEATRDAVLKVAQQVIDEACGLDHVTTSHEEAPAGDPRTTAVVPTPRLPGDTSCLSQSECQPKWSRQHPEEQELLDDLTAAEEQLKNVVEKARDAADRARAALLEGRPPADTDLTLLAAVASAFSRARVALATVGATDVPDRLADVLEAIGEQRARAERRKRNAETRRVVATVAALDCSPDSAVSTVIADARQRAERLLTKREWDEQDEACAQVLALLVRLAGMKDRSDAQQEVVALQQQLSVAHPPYAVAAVLYQQIAVAEDGPVSEVQATPQPEDPAEAQRTPGPTGCPGPATRTDDTPGSDGDRDDPAISSDPVERLSQSADAMPQRPSSPLTAAETDGTDRVEPRDVEPVLARLIAEKRFGLAAQLAQATDRPATDAAAMRLASAATLLRSGTGRVAQYIEESLHDWEGHEESDTDALSLLLLPTLVNAALVTGAPVVGAHLRALAPQLPDALHEMAIMVGERALQGALLIAPPHAVMADVSQSESELRAAVDACQALLSVPRLRFQRASAIVQRWLAPTGLLGSALAAIVAGAPDAEQRADELLEQLTRRSQVEGAIDEMDAALRGPGGRGIQGSGRSNVRHCLERVRDAVRRWRALKRDLEAVREEENAWAFQSVASLRLSLLGLRDRVADDLAAAERSSAVLAKATAHVARDLFAEIFAGLDSGVRSAATGPEPDVHQVMNAELYKAPLPVPAGRVTVEDLLEAVDRSWDEAIEYQLRHDEFGVIHTIMDLADLQVLPALHTLTLPEERRARLAATERNRRTTLADEQRQLAARLRRSQADAALTVEQDVNLQELLADARAHLANDAPGELAAARRKLDRVEALLPRYREEAAERLRARLSALTDVSAEDRERVLRNVDTDSLATATELVYFLELGEPVPEIRSEDSHLEAFFPAVPDALPGGVNAELVAAVRGRGRYVDHAVLDYAGLPEEEAERAASALELWSGLAATRDPRPQQDQPQVESQPGLVAARVRDRSGPAAGRPSAGEGLQVLRTGECSGHRPCLGTGLRLADQGSGRKASHSSDLGAARGQVAHHPRPAGSGREQLACCPLRNAGQQDPYRVGRRLPGHQADPGGRRRGAGLSHRAWPPARGRHDRDATSVLGGQSLHQGETRPDRPGDVLRSGPGAQEHSRPDRDSDPLRRSRSGQVCTAR
ncbi:hypothetical protein [Streptomyces alkaliterrae]|uniref:Uncharacterized protein n=1 Tax=Streptomyces alkaliterrae TaxID=2213162 RepID=A0A5P0YM33_9ACTN|nr:hypothetical protein [Streptomyces alkaliterrae]MBB1257859.1 hypothetical protein [Streptomyces alkaliterrae]MQS01298.1 hypothetical protein [Streptomyces alkaliterrae]